MYQEKGFCQEQFLPLYIIWLSGIGSTAKDAQEMEKTIPNIKIDAIIFFIINLLKINILCNVTYGATFVIIK